MTALRPRVALLLALLSAAPAAAVAGPRTATTAAVGARPTLRARTRTTRTRTSQALRRTAPRAARTTGRARAHATAAQIAVYDVGDSFADASIAHATLAASNRGGAKSIARPGRTAAKTLRTQRTVRSVYRQMQQTADFFEQEFGWSRWGGDSNAMTAYVSGEVPYDGYAYFDPEKGAFFIGQEMAPLIAPYRVRDITPHELTHDWVLQTTGLGDSDGTQAGAWNEHVADAMSILVRMSLGRQTATTVDWRVGVGARGKATTAERSFVEPEDPSVAIPGVRTMAQYRGDANVYENEGIPNHWFYVAAQRLGGATYRSLGHVMFEATTRYMRASNPGFLEHAFSHYAAATVVVASELAAAGQHGMTAQGVDAIRASWHDAGIDVDHLHEQPGVLPPELAARLAQVVGPRAARGHTGL